MMLFVGIGGMLGAISRYAIGQWISKWAPKQFPFGTWMINISGSFALGLLVALHQNTELDEAVWLLLGTGYFGAYTTFSTFSYETFQLLQHNRKVQAILYITTSSVLGILFAFIGMHMLD